MSRRYHRNYLKKKFHSKKSSKIGRFGWGRKILLGVPNIEQHGLGTEAVLLYGPKDEEYFYMNSGALFKFCSIYNANLN